MGSSLLLGTLLFSYVNVGCFSPIVVVEDQSVAVRDGGDGFVDEGAPVVNGTDDDSEGSTDDSDEEDETQDLVLTSEGIQPEFDTKFDNNEEESNSMNNIEDSEVIDEQ